MRAADVMRRENPELKLPARSTADDPNFLKVYFRASRLHFLGTWKLRIEQLMRRWGVGPAEQFPASDSLFATSRNRQPRERCDFALNVRAFW